MVEGARIGDGVVDHVRAVGAERRRAQPGFGTDLGDAVQALGGGEPDPVGVDDADRGDRGAAHRRRGGGDGVELAVGGGVEDLVAADRGQPGRIGEGGGAVSGDRHGVVLAFPKGCSGRRGGVGGSLADPVVACGVSRAPGQGDGVAVEVADLRHGLVEFVHVEGLVT